MHLSAIRRKHEENCTPVQTVYETMSKLHIRTNIECDNFRVYTRLPSSDSNHRISTFMSGSLKPVLKFNRGGCLRFEALPEIPLLWRRVNVDVSCKKKKKSGLRRFKVFLSQPLFYLTLGTTWIFVVPPAQLQSCRKGKLYGVCQHSYSRSARATTFTAASLTFAKATAIHLSLQQQID